MKTIVIDDYTRSITIGIQQENKWRQVEYKYDPEWTGGEIIPYFLRPGEVISYPLAHVERDAEAGTVTVMLTNTDLFYPGRGALEYKYKIGDVVAKSKVFPVRISGDIASTEGDPPSGWDDWKAEVEGYATAAQESAQSAHNDAEAASGYAADAKRYKEQTEQAATDALRDIGNAKSGALDDISTAKGNAVNDVQAEAESVHNAVARILPTDSASGAIASFPDGSDLVPMQSLEVSIEPVQSGSGTPSPDNVRPISGWDEVEAVVCGKNLFDKSDSSKVISGLYIDNGKVVGGSTSRAIAYIPCKPNTTYTVQRIRYDSNTRFMWGWSKELPQRDTSVFDVESGGNSGTIGQKTTVTVTTGADAKYLVGWISWDSTLENELNTLQIEVGTTATSYEPYTSTTHTTTLPSTVYGGTLDMVTGVLTVDRAMVTLNGSSTPSFSSVSQDTTADGSKYVGYISASVIAKANAQAFSDKYKWVDAPMSNLHVGECNTRGSYIRFVLADQSLDTLAKLNTYLADNPIQLCYELAQPTTTTLTPQEIAVLLGTNNVWSDAGQTRVVYSADIQKYIDKKLD